MISEIEETTVITATLKRKWEMTDGTTDGKTQIEVGPGTFELERIPNPYGHNNNWLVLKGTKTGWAEGAWKQWINGILANREGCSNFGKPIDWGDAEIILEEGGQIVPPPMN